MSESTNSELVELIRIAQDNYDDGVQDILLYFSNGRTIPQKWEWPDLQFRGSDEKESAYKLYEKAIASNVDVNVLYGIITTVAKQIGGEVLETVAIVLP